MKWLKKKKKLVSKIEKMQTDLDEALEEIRQRTLRDAVMKNLSFIIYNTANHEIISFEKEYNKLTKIYRIEVKWKEQ